MKTAWISALAAVGLAACQSVESKYVDLSSGQIANGLHYALPKALMTVEMIVIGDEIYLGVSRPFLVGDPEATYTLNGSSGVFAAQRYRYRVDPQTRLLSYISTVSEGKAGDILLNLARAAGGIDALPRAELDAGSKTEIQVYSKVIDPFEYGCEFAQEKCELTKLTDELRTAALEFLGCNMEPTDGSARPAQCLNIERRKDYFTISLEPIFKLERGPPRASARTAAATCGSSICYRAPAPYRMRVAVLGVRDVSEVVMLPNKAPIMSLDLPAGVFATSKSRVSLVYGMPANVDLEQGNELVGITAIPLTMIKGFFDAVGEVVQLRINYDTSGARLLEAEQRRQKAQDDYDTAERARRQAIDAAIAAEIATRNGDANAEDLANAAAVRAEAANQLAAQAKASSQELEGAATTVGRTESAVSGNLSATATELQFKSGENDPDADHKGEDGDVTTLSPDAKLGRLFQLPVIDYTKEGANPDPALQTAAQKAAAAAEAARRAQTPPAPTRPGGNQPPDLGTGVQPR